MLPIFVSFFHTPSGASVRSCEKPAQVWHHCRASYPVENLGRDSNGTRAISQEASLSVFTYSQALDDACGEQARDSAQ
jgi:hypothetical protein